MGDHMQCPFCLTQDIKYFKEGVCRRCIHLRYGVLEEDDFQFSDNSEYTLSFTLTPYQQAIAQKVVTSIQTQNNKQHQQDFFHSYLFKSFYTLYYLIF